MTKSKFDKRKCKPCIYHGNRLGSGGISCNYSGITDKTCLKRGTKGTVIDSRGEDYYNCLLFEPGKSAKKVSAIYVGKKIYEGRG
jgi:hypothetical protein